MIDLSAIKQAAHVVSDEQGKSVVQLPLNVWQDLIAQLDHFTTTLHSDDWSWLELTSQSFDFWDNDEDAVYDNL